MIIGVDTRIPVKNKTGIGYILDNILPLLLDQDNNEYKFYGDSFGLKRPRLRCFDFGRLLTRGLNLIWKALPIFPINLLIGKTDVFLFPNFISFPSVARKKILMVADLSFVYFPEFVERKNRKYLLKNVPISIKNSDKIITISENAKKEIMKEYSVVEEKIEVIPLGCKKGLEKIEDVDKIEEVKKKYFIKGEYILFVGTVEPRKNIVGLVEAYSRIGEEKRNRFSLVICGGKGWYYNEVFDLVERLGLINKVVFTGYVEEEDMSSIYSGASIFVFPSFYEGFGLPVLEAFKCGIPVVSSNRSSLPEVCGEACVYCDPYSTESIASAIEKVVDDGELREKITLLGKKQLDKFSWDSACKKIIKIINE